MKIFEFTRTRPGQSGFSLVELLVAVTISLFILAGVGVVMVSSRTSYEVQDFNARLQESARFAVQFLSYDLRMAGYFGCATKLGGVAPLTVSANTYTSIKGATVGIGDNLTILYADPTYTLLADAGAVKDATSIVLNDVDGVQSHFKDGNTIVIADCGGAETAVISGAPSVSGSAVTLTLGAGLARNFTEKTEVRLLQTRAYSVVLNSQNIPTLRVGGVDLVEGVELIRFLFGLDTDGDGGPNSYANRGSSPDLSTAVSAQIGVLVRSISNYRSPGSDNNTTREFGTNEGQENDGGYPILDLDEGAVEGAIDDLRVNRHVFTTTLKIRNRT